MTSFLHIVLIGILLFLIWKRTAQDHPLFLFNAFVGIKLTSGTFLGLIYLLYYGGGDTFTYFNTASQFVADYGQNPIRFIEGLTQRIQPNEPRTDFFIKLISPVVWLSNSNYWIAGLYLSTFNLACTWWLITKLVRLWPNDRLIIYFAFLLIPSAIFWSSGIMKDTLANAFTWVLAGIIVIGYHDQRIRWQHVVTGLVLLTLLIPLKYYAAGALLLTCPLLVFTRLSKRSLPSYLFYAVFLFVGIYCMKYLHPWLRLERLPLTIYEVAQQIGQGSDQGENIEMALEPTYTSLIYHAPVALFTGLFRPFLTETSTWISLGLRIENMVLLLLALLNLYLIRHWRLTPISIATLLFVFGLATFLALATPNFGTLSRYRTLFLPFFAYLLAYIPFHHWFLHKEGNS